MGTDKTAVTQKKGMNTITIQVGKKDSGKTNFCKISLMTQKPNRALILDIDNEYTDYPFLKDRSFLNSNEKGIYRINFHPKRISLAKMQNIYLYNCDYFANGLIICENPMKLWKKLPIDLLGAICTCRSMNRSIILNLTSLKKSLNPKLIGNANFYRLYKHAESIASCKKILGDYYELFVYAEMRLSEELNVSPDNVSVIDLGLDKIV